MADYPRPGSSDRTLRSHGEQIRRIRTRIPQDAGFSVYQVQEADLFNDPDAGEGWFLENGPYPHLVRQGNLVHFFGLFFWARPVDMETYPYSPRLILRPDNIPDEFRPVSDRRIDGFGTGFDDDRLWVLYIDLIAGRFLELSDSASSGTAVFPFGDLTDAGNQYVCVNAVYAIEPTGNVAPVG